MGGGRERGRERGEERGEKRGEENHESAHNSDLGRAREKERAGVIERRHDVKRRDLERGVRRKEEEEMKK